jgi:hypothetical protein
MPQTLTYEFIIPSQIFIADDNDWPTLRVARDDLTMVIHRPITGNKVVPAEGTRGNEGIDVGHSIFHVGVKIDDGAAIPEWYLPLKPIQECLQWIRVVGFQYWLATLPTMSKAIARGSIIFESGKYSNFAGYRTPFVPRPLTKEQWEWIGRQLTAGRVPSVPDLLVGDAMVSFSEQDYLQTVIRLGVICELELNAFLEDLLTLHTQPVRDLYDERKPFEWKLKNVPAILGSEKYQNHNSRWAKELCVLYGLRGAAIHHASCKINGKEVGFEEVSGFFFATTDFLDWTKAQRRRLGIPFAT